MKPITSFLDAKSRLSEVQGGLAEIRDFLELAEKTLSAVNMLKGESDAASTAPHVTAPTGWADRVIAIYRQADKPLFQKDVAERYRKLQWPDYDSEDLYNRVSGAVAYLHKKKGKLEKSVEGYHLKE